LGEYNSLADYKADVFELGSLAKAFNNQVILLKNFIPS
jgi:hypothetical protein